MLNMNQDFKIFKNILIFIEKNIDLTINKYLPGKRNRKPNEKTELKNKN